MSLPDTDCFRRSRPPIGGSSFWLTLLAGLCLAGTGYGQSAPSIERVRIGLPAGGAGQEEGTTRNGTWAPVAVTLKGSSQGNPRGVYRLRVETTDLQEVAYQATVAVPSLAAEGLRTVTGYIVPGGDGATFRVTLETVEGQKIKSLALASRESVRAPLLSAEDILFFGVGAGLPQLRKAAEKLDRPDGKEPPEDSGKRQVGYTTDVSNMPDRWIGYDAADVVVLMTNNTEFVNRLMQDDEAPRRNALVEWVRRGGQLVISVGRNQQAVGQLLAKMPLINCKVTGSTQGEKLPETSRGWSKREIHKPVLQNVELATLEVGPRADVLVREGRKAVLVQGSSGLGRVILVGFDLDGANFTGWDGNEAFWTRLQEEMAPYLARRVRRAPGQQPNIRGQPVNVQFGNETTSDDPLQAQLKRGIDSFEEIPPVSFGWVALFILFYIGLVGPLDYFVLKKLFKRLEFTWVTFPVSVIVVSAIAYFTTYTLKGEQLRVNKVDLVEVDLQGGQVYGSTWFSLFSPRVAAYTVGIEPAAGTWTANPPIEAAGPVVTLLEAGDTTLRAGSQALFRRPYEYAEEEAGLIRVPIPVWSTRSFKASWRAPLLAQSPVIGITDEVGPLRRSRTGPGLSGRITNHLPVRLQHAAVFYQHNWYVLGTLEPGEQKRVDPLFAGDAQGKKKELGGWFTDFEALKPDVPLAPTGRPVSANFLAATSSPYSLIKRMLFFREYAQPVPTNAGLRRLDQSWRLHDLPEYPAPDRPQYRDEAVLVARVPLLSDEAEAVTTHGSSPSRLWLGELPRAEGTRPTVPGIMTQETYVRIYIPIVR